MINYQVHETIIKTVRSADQDFYLKDGIVTAPRSGFEIHQSCPREYRMIISECINQGWLKPIAHLYDYERLYETLKYE